MPDAVFTRPVIAIARRIAGFFQKIGKRCAAGQGDVLDLRLIPGGIHHRLVRIIGLRNPQMQIVRIGECDRHLVLFGRQMIGRRKELSHQLRIILHLFVGDGRGDHMLRRKFCGFAAGLHKRLPAVLGVLAVVLGHGIDLGQRLNGAQVDFGFIHLIVENQRVVFQRICIIICGLPVRSNVYACGRTVGVEQSIEIVLRFAAYCTESLCAGNSTVFKILLAVIILLQRLVEIRCVQLRCRNQLANSSLQLCNGRSYLIHGRRSIQYVLRFGPGTVGCCERCPKTPSFTCNGICFFAIVAVV